MTNPSLTVLQAQLSLHLARAAWWTAYANTPANLARRVRVGGMHDSNTVLCKSELIDDAMNTAAVHLTNAQATLDAINELAANS